MEKLQQKFGNKTHIETSSSLLAATIAGLVLSGCANQPPRYEPRNEPQLRQIPYEVPKPKLTSKTHTHNGPLWDPMCTYIYDNRTKVLELCNHKSAIRGQSYTRTIRENTAAQTKVTPPIYSYRMNPFTKQQEQYILIPGRNDYIPGTSNFKTIICTPMTPFSQINGEQLPKNEFCI